MEGLLSTRPIPSSFITKTKDAEQTYDLSVNRLSHVQLKGNLEKKIAGWSLRILSSRRTTWHRRFVIKKFKLKNLKMKIICAKKVCDKEKKKKYEPNVWWKLKNLNCDKPQKSKVFYKHIYNFFIYSYSFILIIASKPLRLGSCYLERMFTPTKCYI